MCCGEKRSGSGQWRTYQSREIPLHSVTDSKNMRARADMQGLSVTIGTLFLGGDIMAAGRPRTFCTEKALDCAMQVFWRKGYEGASMVDLTTAMGINSPSLYAAYGSKEGLFRAVLERYEARRDKFMEEVFAAPTAREVAAL